MNPPESFVPLTAAPAPPSPREFRVAIINGHDHVNGGTAPKTAGFQSLEPPRPAALNGSSPVMDKHPGEPRVTVQRDGDRVTHFRIQCTCGQIMDLACVYDAAPPPQA